MKYKYFAILSIVSVITLAAWSSFTRVGSATSVGKAEPVVSATPKVRSISDITYFDSEYDGKAVTKTDAEWKKILTPAAFKVMRAEGTEAPYSGALLKNHKHGIYYCAACHLAVFRSDAKFESGTGWPSFFQPIYKKNVTEKVDRSLGEERTEVECSRCGAHLGHVFDDGPKPTGLRYCMNSVALTFKPSK